MIVFNFTGLNRVYWLPKVDRQTDGDGLWYADLKWLGVEVTIFSVAMGKVFVQRLNREMEQKHP